MVTIDVDTAKDYHHFQRGRDLLAQAFSKGEQPERVPVYAQHHEFSLARYGLTCREFYQTPELMVYCQLETCERFEIDFPTVDWDCYNIEAEALGQVIVFDEDNMPDVDRERPFIADLTDIEKVVTPDFDNEGRCQDIVRLMDMTATKTGIPPSIVFCGPFSFAANIRGIEALIFDILDMPEQAHELMTRAVEEVIGPWINYLLDRFPDVEGIAGADATASIPILSPTMAREWVIPYIARLREVTRDDVSIPNWVGEANLAEPELFVDMKLEVTGHFIEGQDPDVARLGPQFYVDYAGRHDVPLILGVGAAFLALAEPREVFERVTDYLRAGMEHDRFALYLCNLGATTPEANVRAAIDAVKTNGVY